MSDVKRYDVTEKYIGTGEYVGAMVESATGDWVAFSDYDALAAENAALKAQCDTLLTSQHSSIEYAIKLQRMIEAARRRELPLPSPELHHHKMLTDVLEDLAALKARLDEWDKAADFYRRCKVDPRSHEVGAMRDAVEWLCSIAARAADNAGEEHGSNN